MYCPKCGAQVPDDAKFCASCGNPFTANTQPKSPTSGAGSVDISSIMNDIQSDEGKKSSVITLAVAVVAAISFFLPYLTASAFGYSESVNGFSVISNLFGSSSLLGDMGFIGILAALCVIISFVSTVAIAGIYGMSFTGKPVNKSLTKKLAILATVTLILVLALFLIGVGALNEYGYGGFIKVGFGLWLGAILEIALCVLTSKA